MTLRRLRKGPPSWNAMGVVPASWLKAARRGSRMSPTTCNGWLRGGRKDALKKTLGGLKGRRETTTLLIYLAAAA